MFQGLKSRVKQKKLEVRDAQQQQQSTVATESKTETGSGEQEQQEHVISQAPQLEPSLKATQATKDDALQPNSKEGASIFAALTLPFTSSAPPSQKQQQNDDQGDSAVAVASELTPKEREEYLQSSVEDLVAAINKRQRKYSRLHARMADLVTAYKQLIATHDKTKVALEETQDKAASRIKELKQQHKHELEAKEQMLATYAVRAQEHEVQSAADAARIRDLASELQEAKVELRERASEFQAQQQQRDTMALDMASLHTQVDTLKERLQTASNAKARLQEECQEKEQRLLALQQSEGSWKHHHHQEDTGSWLDTSTDTLPPSHEAEMLQLQQRLATTQAEKETAEEELSELKLQLTTTVDKAVLDIKAKDKSLALLTEQLKAADQEAEATRIQVSELMQERDELKAELFQLNATLTSSTSDNDALVREVDSLKHIVADLKAQLQEANRTQMESSRDLGEQLDSARTLLTQQTLQVDTLKLKLEEETRAHQALQQELQSVKRELSAASTRAKEAETRHVGITAEIDSVKRALTDQCKQLELEVAALTKEAQDKEIQAQDMSSQLALAQADVQSSREAVERMEQIKQQQEELNTELQITLDKQVDEATHLASQLQALEQSKGDLKAECDALTARVSDLQSTKQNLMQQLTDLTESSAREAKVQQQHIAELRRTLQRQMRSNGDDAAPAKPSAQPPSSTSTPPSSAQNSHISRQDSQYLKNIVLKFMSSKPKEAVQLTRVIATLLHFTKEEEDAARETFRRNTSWGW
eukprot:m.353160 g.353160  ORF g.353160 m.353160 type:complete len:764 (+) comp16697_c0_seq1:153-2444(+)